MNQAGILVQFAVTLPSLNNPGRFNNGDSDMDISGWVSLNFSNTFHSSQHFHFILGFCLSFQLWTNSHHLFRTVFRTSSPTLLLFFFRSNTSYLDFGVRFSASSQTVQKYFLPYLVHYMESQFLGNYLLVTSLYKQAFPWGALADISCLTFSQVSEG